MPGSVLVIVKVAVPPDCEVVKVTVVPGSEVVCVDTTVVAGMLVVE